MILFKVFVGKQKLVDTLRCSLIEKAEIEAGKHRDVTLFQSGLKVNSSEIEFATMK